MEAFVDVGATVWLLPAPAASAASRKLKYSWEAIEQRDAMDEGAAVMCGCNTQRPNRLVHEVVQSRSMPGLDQWTACKAEPKFDVEMADGTRHSGRSDHLLTYDDDAAGGAASAARKHYVEVKN